MPIDLLADEGPSSPIDLLEDEGIPDKKPSKGIFGNLMDYEKGLGLGLVQGAGDVGASIGNFPADIYEHFTGKKSYHIPHPELQKYYPEGNAGHIGSMIGEPIGGLAAPGGIVSKALKAFNNPLARIFSGAVGGGLAGAATQENDRTGSGMLGAALGGAIPLAGGIIKGAKGLTSSGIAEKISGDKQAVKQLARKEYGELFSDALNKGISKVIKPKIDVNKIVSHSMPRYHEALLDYMKKPSIESAHWAQSDLGSLKRHLEKVDAARGLTSTEHKTLKEVVSAQDKIKKSMFENKLEKTPELAERYNKLSAKYKENVIPYEELKHLRKYEEGKLLPKDLVDLLNNNKEFRATLAKKYPQMKLNQLLNTKGAKWIGAGATSALGFKGAEKLME